MGHICQLSISGSSREAFWLHDGAIVDRWLHPLGDWRGPFPSARTEEIYPALVGGWSVGDPTMGGLGLRGPCGHMGRTTCVIIVFHNLHFRRLKCMNQYLIKPTLSASLIEPTSEREQPLTPYPSPGYTTWSPPSNAPAAIRVDLTTASATRLGSPARASKPKRRSAVKSPDGQGVELKWTTPFSLVLERLHAAQ
eukprot:1176155-Prorocentrum_minimum.AAC.1